MKKILLLFIALASTVYVYGQKATKPDLPMDDETKTVMYKGVVELSGVTRSELYKRGINFFKSYYAKYSAGIFQVQDSTNGKIEIKAQFDTYKTLPNGVKAKADIVKYTFTLDIKDGKYRYTITKINIQFPSYKGIEVYMSDTDPQHDEHWSVLTQADEYFNNTIGSLREGMEKPSTKVKKDDW